MLIHSVTGATPGPFSSSEGRLLDPFLFLLRKVGLWWTANSFPHTSMFQTLPEVCKVPQVSRI